IQNSKFKICHRSLEDFKDFKALIAPKRKNTKNAKTLRGHIVEEMQGLRSPRNRSLPSVNEEVGYRRAVQNAKTQ
ncbi:MAG: hypothetical protein IKL67_04980, partial [Tidjanibacter sp.]|nr:hypothetical protein [Tidjanibacter sp.]